LAIDLTGELTRAPCHDTGDRRSQSNADKPSLMKLHLDMLEATCRDHVGHRPSPLLKLNVRGTVAALLRERLPRKESANSSNAPT